MRGTRRGQSCIRPCIMRLSLARDRSDRRCSWGMLTPMPGRGFRRNVAAPSPPAKLANRPVRRIAVVTYLMPGDPAPWFTAAASNNPRFVFSSVGGRHIVLTFYGSAAAGEAGDAIRLLTAADGA